MTVSIVIDAVLAALALFFFGAFIHSIIIRRKYADSCVRIEPKSSGIYLYPFAVLMFVGIAGYGVYRYIKDSDPEHLIWAGTELLYAVYFLLIRLNIRNYYITETHFISPDKALKAKYYKYRLTDEKLEMLSAVKNSSPDEYKIIGDRERLEQILSANYQPIDES